MGTLKFLHKNNLSVFSTLPPVLSTSRYGNLPLSLAQRRLWFLDKLEPGNSLYNIPISFRLTGSFNNLVFEQSLVEIVRRHEILRTFFDTTGGEPVQVISPEVDFTLPVTDLRILPETEREIEAHHLLKEAAKQPFNLAKGPLLRVKLLRLAEEDHVLLLTIHHIAFDDWSFDVLFRELTVLYEAFSIGKASPLPKLPIQYADFACWQRRLLKGEVLEHQLEYWKQQLSGNLPVLNLPTDRPRPAVRTHRGEAQLLSLSRNLTEALNELSRQEGVTLFMTLLAAFKTLLYRYTGEQDIIVGSPCANRNRPEVEELIGCFVNTLVLRTDLSGNPSFRELLARVSEVTLEAYEYQDLPFENLVDELQPVRGLSHTPLFQVMFALQNNSEQTVKLQGLTASSLNIHNGISKFDLTLYMREETEGLTGYMEYDTELISASMITRMIDHFRTLLKSVVTDPDKPIPLLSLMTEAERHQMLVKWNDTQIDYAKDSNIPQLFEAQAERCPEATAFIYEGQKLTYHELNRRANQIAHYLQTIGVSTEVIVGICTERSLEMPVGLLGILKAGGCFLSLDPAHPKERLAFMLEDACVPILLTQKKFEAVMPKGKVKKVFLDSDLEIFSQHSEENPVCNVTAETSAYVIYTSGSTGRPKGVLGLHRGVLNRCSWMWKIFPFAAEEICCQKTSLSFVDSIWELFGPLLQGIPTVITSDEVMKSPQKLINTLATHHVTRIALVPSLLRVILDTHSDLQNRLPELKFWTTSGEALSIELCRRFLKSMPQSVLINLYGSSEVSADSTWYEPRKDKLFSCVPIGRPIANTQVYILDTHMQPVPIGLPGELHIGGDGLAQGYLNRPELTEKAFICNTFNHKADCRLYKTGDLGRWLPDGNIELISRIDHQVKIRGFRIELGEVEMVLSQHPGVQEAVVTAREEERGDKRLVAYFLSNQKQKPTIDELRSYLKQKLPDYMVPSVIVLLDALPLTPSGKVNRRKLPAPDIVRQEVEETLVTPRDELELQLAKIWEKVLGIKDVGIKDNFFDVGGHSLLAVHLFDQIEKVFNKDLPLATLFQAPTLDQLASVLRQEGWSSTWSSLVPMQHRGTKTSFFCTHGCGGIVFHMHGLARHLFPEQPFYGLKAQGLEKGQTPHTRIEDMASFYIKEIQTVQPDGPYIIGSSGDGGAIALEMAQQLKLQGQNVALVVLFNPVTLQPNLSHLSFIGDIYGGSFMYFFHCLVDFIHNRPLLPYIKYTIFNRALINWRIFHRFVPMNIHREHRFRDAITNALLNYTPQAYTGRITCFLCEKFPIKPQQRIGDWPDIASGGLDVRFVPGTIEGMWREPNVQILAEQLKACLDEAQTDG